MNTNLTATRPALRHGISLAFVAALTVLRVAAGAAQQLTATERAAIDSSARAVLRSTGAPSALIAVVRDGRIRVRAGVRRRTHRSKDGGHPVDALRDRIREQAVHRNRRAAARGREQAVAR